MAETQLKLAEAEKNIYWLTFVRSPGRGGSVCRHSWISDLSASVSVSPCVSLSPSLSLPPLLHSPPFSHRVDLISFLYKRLRERWQCLHGPWVVLFCFWLRFPEEKCRSPSLLTFGTHKIISKTQVEHMPPLNQSL